MTTRSLRSQGSKTANSRQTHPPVWGQEDPIDGPPRLRQRRLFREAAAGMTRQRIAIPKAAVLRTAEIAEPWGR